jgi:hypothetical protein
MLEDLKPQSISKTKQSAVSWFSKISGELEKIRDQKMKWYGIDESVLCQYEGSDTTSPPLSSLELSSCNVKDIPIVADLAAVPKL